MCSTCTSYCSSYMYSRLIVHELNVDQSGLINTTPLLDNLLKLCFVLREVFVNRQHWYREANSATG